MKTLVQTQCTHLGGMQVGKRAQTKLKSLMNDCRLALLRLRTGGGSIQEHELSKDALPCSAQRTLGRWDPPCADRCVTEQKGIQQRTIVPAM